MGHRYKWDSKEAQGMQLPPAWGAALRGQEESGCGRRDALSKGATLM